MKRAKVVWVAQWVLFSLVAIGLIIGMRATRNLLSVDELTEAVRASGYFALVGFHSIEDWRANFERGMFFRAATGFLLSMLALMLLFVLWRRERQSKATINRINGVRHD